jgi:hypothetical protein
MKLNAATAFLLVSFLCNALALPTEQSNLVVRQLGSVNYGHVAGDSLAVEEPANTKREPIDGDIGSADADFEPVETNDLEARSLGSFIASKLDALGSKLGKKVGAKLSQNVQQNLPPGVSVSHGGIPAPE